jgi:histidine triad (HIT) family protein
LPDYRRGNIYSKIIETPTVLGFVPIEEASPGHTVLVPKTHFGNIFEIDNSTLEEIITLTKSLAQSMLEKLGATGINLLHASGRDAQQSIMHFHIHLVPRYPNDGLDLWLFKNKIISELPTTG